MKTIIYVVLFISYFTGKIEAQTALKADAGKDTVYCIIMDYHNNTINNLQIYLGGQPTAIGGKPPYLYNWTMYSKTTKKQYSILKDSCINNKANPILYISKYYDLESYNYIDTLNDRFIFKVIVKDSNNITAQDSSTIIFSRYGAKPVVTGGIQFPCMEVYTKDSIQLGPCGTIGGIHPFSSFHWTPEYGLSNPNISNPKAVLVSGLSYTNYCVSYVDSVGCSINAGFTLTDIKNGDLKTGYVSYKNPVSQSQSMNFTSELIGSMLQIVSIKGVVVLHRKIAEPELPLGSIITESGMYYYTLTTTQGKVLSGSFVRE